MYSKAGRDSSRLGDQTPLHWPIPYHQPIGTRLQRFDEIVYEKNNRR